MSFQNTAIKHRISAAVRRWITHESEEQEKRYREIARDMDDLAPTRHKWYLEFFERIQTRGFNTDGDQLEKIASGDIPVKPSKRKDRVVW